MVARVSSPLSPRAACLRDALMADLRVPPFGRPTFTVSYPFRVR